MTSRKTGDADSFFYYFAYGSNLLDERIHLQIKSAKYVSTGSLSNYRLDFYDHALRWMGAVASVELSKGDEVWGCVWQVPWSSSDELDKQESGYHRFDVDIKVQSSAITCRTYRYSNPNRQRKLPSPHYKLVIISGAIEHSLPSDYIEKLKAIEDNGYKGPIAVDLIVLNDLNSSS
uniref:gamma-glutamylcyclotransferase n=1 Tax=Elaeophora elaphi TaxID=1147741 RepID=A0A0R3RIF0_9BILA